MWVLYISRFILGFSQAFVVIYAPVWINEFSPAEANTRWMAGFHSACVVGILGGYISAQVIVNYFSYYTTWRLTIYIQGGFQFLLSVITMFVDNKNLDVKEKSQEENVGMLNGVKSDKDLHFPKSPTRHEFIKHASEKRIDTVDADEMGHLCHQFRMLCSNYVFIFVTLCLCSVYFVVTGIQFWTTAYFLLVLEEDPNTTMITFALVCITAPLAGVSVGSYFSDLNGGYKGENLLKAIKL
jgi:MFS family permease